MITDDFVKQLFQEGLSALEKQAVREEAIKSQIYRGKRIWQIKEDLHPGGCERNMLVFKKFNIIPKHCFTCYKVVIEPRTVLELFKLQVVFGGLALPLDNTRKCMVERRKKISGSYKGYIYCRDLEDGKEILPLVQRVIAEEISNEIPIKLKRGCSEYALAYPEFPEIGQDTPPMVYKEEWQVYEDIVDKQFVVKKRPPEAYAFKPLEYTLRDVEIMIAWLHYAATIGDSSYLKISGSKLQPVQDLARPSSFHPTERE